MHTYSFRQREFLQLHCLRGADEPAFPRSTGAFLWSECARHVVLVRVSWAGLSLELVRPSASGQSVWSGVLTGRACATVT